MPDYRGQSRGGVISGEPYDQFGRWSVMENFATLPAPDTRLFTNGRNQYGTTAQGATSGFTESTKQAGDLQGWTQVSAGDEHSLGIRNNGQLWSWGSAFDGSTGLNRTTPDSLVPERVGTRTDWESVSAGTFYSLGIADGRLFGWGDNSNYANGFDPASTRTLVPTQVGAFTDWEQVAAGGAHSLGLRDGKIYGWGFNGDGATGQGTFAATDTTSPTQIGIGTDWEFIAAGISSSYGIRNGGELWAWGNNFYYQLGDAGGLNQSSPVRIGLFDDWVSVAGGRFHGIGIRANGLLYSWGLNERGLTGQDLASGFTETPTQVGSLAGWTKVAAGEYASHAIQDGRMYVFGSNESYTTGLGTIVGVNLVPVRRDGFTRWTDVSSIFLHTLSI